jgi:hypothetical protein
LRHILFCSLWISPALLTVRLCIFVAFVFWSCSFVSAYITVTVFRWPPLSPWALFFLLSTVYYLEDVNCSLQRNVWTVRTYNTAEPLKPNYTYDEGRESLVIGM